MRKIFALLVLFITVLFIGSTYLFFQPETPVTMAMDVTPPSAAEYKLLSAGKILIRELRSNSKHIKSYEAQAMAHCDLNRIYQTIIDFEHSAEFMPLVTKAEVLERKKSEAVVNYTLKLAVTGMTKKYRLKMTFSKKRDEAMIRWHLIPWPGLSPKETIRNTEGMWILKSMPKSKNRVLLIYRVTADPGKIPPGCKWIVNLLTKHSIPELVEAIKQRALGTNSSAQTIKSAAAVIERLHLSYKPLMRTPIDRKLPHHTSETPMNFPGEWQSKV